MKRFFTHKALPLFLVLTLSIPFSGVLASTFSKPIRATITQNITYSLNNKAVVPNSTSIVYKDKIYVPIEDIAPILGYFVSTKNNQINLSTQPIPKPSPTTKTIQQAIILGIDFASNTLTVAPSGTQTDNPMNQVSLKITPTTKFSDGQSNTAYGIQDLNTSMPIKVVYTPGRAATPSTPATGTASSITLLNRTPIQPR